MERLQAQRWQITAIKHAVRDLTSSDAQPLSQMGIEDWWNGIGDCRAQTYTSPYLNGKYYELITHQTLINHNRLYKSYPHPIQTFTRHCSIKISTETQTNTKKDG